jgi:hypothetical protein
VEIEMSLVNAAARAKELQPESTDLDLRYGKIGILAVAAAVRYTGAGQKPAAATLTAIDQRFIELAP